MAGSARPTDLAWFTGELGLTHDCLNADAAKTMR